MMKRGKKKGAKNDRNNKGRGGRHQTRKLEIKRVDRKR